MCRVTCNAEILRLQPSIHWEQAQLYFMKHLWRQRILFLKIFFFGSLNITVSGQKEMSLIMSSNWFLKMRTKIVWQDLVHLQRSKIIQCSKIISTFSLWRNMFVSVILDFVHNTVTFPANPHVAFLFPFLSFHLHQSPSIVWWAATDKGSREQ